MATSAVENTNTKDKFEAAVNVIQGLPKNGSFQPSHALMLKFYSYYKQATQGVCSIARPAFWDVVGKAKWDAWSKLGDMSSEEAMVKYVEELKTIIEAMPHTEMVSDFVEKLGDFYVLVDDDDTPVPNGDLHPDGSPRKVGQLLRQHRLAQKPSPTRSDGDISTPTSSRLSSSSTTPERHNHHSNDNSPLRDEQTERISIPVKLLNNNIPSNGVNGHSPLRSNHVEDLRTAPNGRVNGFEDSDSEVEEYLDSTDRPQQIVAEAVVHTKPGYPLRHAPEYYPEEAQSWLPLSGVEDSVSCRGGGETPVEGRSTSDLRRTGSTTSLTSQGRGVGDQRGQGARPGGRSHLPIGGAGGGGQDPRYNPSHRTEVNEQIAIALVRLQQDMQSVLTRLNTLEALSVAQTRIRSRTPSENERENRQAQHAVEWWPFNNISGRNVFFIMMWPFIVHLIIRFISRRRNRAKLDAAIFGRR